MLNLVAGEPSLSIPMRKGRHFVRSARRSKKKPIDNLMKLYAKMINIC